ncbi:hypothetical protein GA707_20020 [Nostocoides sp. F2B08]|uniref:hypothetical protein n=1 Tax=Nostocoides sp. F2B08 TaxID=2653936 RepID=UPI0012633366|nr:hypothetical protein [Tetrasphaera sp. F2B08]KAB7739766.1 hypothetical protein GA707_20020 [Tetrasphaera sp. F2B08]
MADTDPARGVRVAEATTVGELLRQADLQARRMLADVDAATAPARVRAWGEVVEAGAEAWRAIPSSGPRGAVDDDINTVHDVARGVHQLIVQGGWPPAGAPDPDAELIVARLYRVSDLVRTRHRPDGPIRPDATGDVEAARTWIMHSVLAATHAVRRSLEQYERALTSGRDRARLSGPTGELANVRELIRRVDVAEGLARGYLDLRWPATARGDRLDPVQPTMLETAINAWQTNAARALTNSPSVADLALVVRTQLDGAVVASAVGGAATHAGLLTHLEGTRMQRALTIFEGSAADLLKTLTLLSGRDRSFQARLVETSAQLRLAYRAIANDGTSLASSDTIRERVDIARALTAVQRGLVAGVDLAWRLHDAGRDPNLQVRAHGAHRIAGKSHQPGPSAGWVEAVDLVHNRLIPAPPPVRYALRGLTQEMTDRAIDAAAASYSTPPRPAQPAGDDLPGRHHRDRPPPATRPDPPAQGPSR